MQFTCDSAIIINKCLPVIPSYTVIIFVGHSPSIAEAMASQTSIISFTSSAVQVKTNQ